MGKIKRGGFIFLVYKGDHSPRHVHVFKDGTRIVKWDLENEQPMVGKAGVRIRRLIQELADEGLL